MGRARRSSAPDLGDVARTLARLSLGNEGGGADGEASFARQSLNSDNNREQDLTSLQEQQQQQQAEQGRMEAHEQFKLAPLLARRLENQVGDLTSSPSANSAKVGPPGLEHSNDMP